MKTNARITVVTTGNFDDRAWKDGVCTIILDGEPSEEEVVKVLAEVHYVLEAYEDAADELPEEFTYDWLETEIGDQCWWHVQPQTVISVTPLGPRSHIEMDLLMEGEDGGDMPKEDWIPSLKEQFPYVEFELLREENPWNGFPLFKVSGFRTEVERFCSEPAIGDVEDWQELIVNEEAE